MDDDLKAILERLCEIQEAANRGSPDRKLALWLRNLREQVDRYRVKIEERTNAGT